MEATIYGLGIKLTKSESRRLEELAKQTGRSKNSVIRCLLRLASARDANALELIRDEYRNMQKGGLDAWS